MLQKFMLIWSFLDFTILKKCLSYWTLKMHNRYRFENCVESRERIIKLSIQSSSQRRIRTDENMRSICPYEFNQTGWKAIHYRSLPLLFLWSEQRGSRDNRRVLSWTKAKLGRENEVNRPFFFRKAIELEWR